ncbi:MAG: hypothetical protein ACI93R_000585 [Flavobacteriales bacterium]|jgi:hypothetical protein
MAVREGLTWAPPVPNPYGRRWRFKLLRAICRTHEASHPTLSPTKTLLSMGFCCMAVREGLTWVRPVPNPYGRRWRFKLLLAICRTHEASHPALSPTKNPAKCGVLLYGGEEGINLGTSCTQPLRALMAAQIAPGNLSNPRGFSPRPLAHKKPR